MEKLFRETIATTLNLPFVVSTRIDKATAERPHFFITYGSKSREGLKAFRETEYGALREHERSRAGANERKRVAKTGSVDLFADHFAETREATIDAIVDGQKEWAKERILAILARGPLRFSEVVDDLLKGFMLRQTNVKDICVDLAKEGRIENSWGPGNRKPSDATVIRLAKTKSS